MTQPPPQLFSFFFYQSWMHLKIEPAATTSLRDSKWCCGERWVLVPYIPTHWTAEPLWGSTFGGFCIFKSHTLYSCSASPLVLRVSKQLCNYVIKSACACACVIREQVLGSTIPITIIIPSSFFLQLYQSLAEADRNECSHKLCIHLLSCKRGLLMVAGCSYL